MLHYVVWRVPVFILHSLASSSFYVAIRNLDVALCSLASSSFYIPMLDYVVHIIFYEVALEVISAFRT